MEITKRKLQSEFFAHASSSIAMSLMRMSCVFDRQESEYRQVKSSDLEKYIDTSDRMALQETQQDRLMLQKKFIVVLQMKLKFQVEIYEAQVKDAEQALAKYQNEGKEKQYRKRRIVIVSWTAAETSPEQKRIQENIVESLRRVETQNGSSHFQGGVRWF